MTLTIGAVLLIAVIALALLADAARPEPRRVTADNEQRRSPDELEIHVTDYRGDVEDASTSAPAPWITAVAVALAAIAAVVLASES